MLHIAISEFHDLYGEDYPRALTEAHFTLRLTGHQPGLENSRTWPLLHYRIDDGVRAIAILGWGEWGETDRERDLSL